MIGKDGPLAAGLSYVQPRLTAMNITAESCITFYICEPAFRPLISSVGEDSMASFTLTAHDDYDDWPLRIAVVLSDGPCRGGENFSNSASSAACALRRHADTNVILSVVVRLCPIAPRTVD